MWSRWSKRGIGAVLALFAVLLGCFFMPDYVSGIIDRNTLGKPETLDAKGVSFEASPELAMQERLRLIAGSDRESITLKNGKLSESEARTLVISELLRFIGSSGLIGDVSDMMVDECRPMFVIDAETSSNMIVWRALLSSNDGQMVTVYIDEETGTILQIVYRNAAVKPELSDEENDQLKLKADRLLELIRAYYEMPAVLKYQLGGEYGYYNVELDFDGDSVALYGRITREYGFSVNDE